MAELCGAGHHPFVAAFPAAAVDKQYQRRIAGFSSPEIGLLQIRAAIGQLLYGRLGNAGDGWACGWLSILRCANGSATSVKPLF